MKPDQRLIVAIVAAAVAMAAWIAFTAYMLWSALEPGERQAIEPLLGERLGPLVVLAWLVAVGLLAFALLRAHRHFVAQPARLLEQAQVMLGPDVQRELAPIGSKENRGLSKTINELVRQRAQLRDEIEHKVQEASRDIEQERNRLAALMSELSQSVVVCNLSGHILLYNQRARSLFRALSPAPASAHGAELIGLGRSIYTVLDQRLVDHALENIRQRMQRGVDDPSTQFVTTTPAGQLLRVQMAPVRGSAGEPADTSQLGGFVLMFDNITQAFEDESLRDKLMHGLTDRSRASLANIQAAIEMLEYPDVEAGQRARFQAVIRDEVQQMSQRIQDLAARTAQGIKTRWPLEDMLGADLVSAAARRIEATYHRLPVGTNEVDATLWLKVDSFSLLQALGYLTGRLLDEFAIRAVQLRLASVSGRAQLDLVWSDQAVGTQTVMRWEMDPMRIGSDSTPLTVRDVVDRHGGEFWFEPDRVRHEVFFRFVLPLAAPHAGDPAGVPSVADGSRPEYYDFDLFRTSASSRALDDRALAELTYTVFDTETTGLDPSRGDEIIQIGAVRIVNGKLLTQEAFEQLIDPRRPISRESIPIHGIHPEMLAGKPTIEQVLPAFHAFVQDTVLVAHNAAFDMRFLQLKEQRVGVRFDQPLLDTLLLSALVHPNQESHHLEAIAERLGVTVAGRHTAMGDALIAAQIFLKLIPLMRERGIHTLGQARAAAQETYHSRLSY